MPITTQPQPTQNSTSPPARYRANYNTRYYIAVAQYNGLNKFRNLHGVRTVTVPPMVQGS